MRLNLLDIQRINRKITAYQHFFHKSYSGPFIFHICSSLVYNGARFTINQCICNVIHQFRRSPCLSSVWRFPYYYVYLVYFPICRQESKEYQVQKYPPRTSWSNKASLVFVLQASPAFHLPVWPPLALSGAPVSRLCQATSRITAVTVIRVGFLNVSHAVCALCRVIQTKIPHISGK